MTDYDVRTQRVQQLRTSATGGRARPAKTAKIVTAGLASAAVLGLTATIGWCTQQASARTPEPAQAVSTIPPDSAIQVLIDQSVRRALAARTSPGPAVVGTASTAPPSSAARIAPAAVAAAAAPKPVAVAVAVPVPVAVAAARPATAAATQPRQQSNGTTKASG